MHNGSGLVITSVDLSLNMTSYSCLFKLLPCVRSGRVEYKHIESNTGFLFISGLHMPPSNRVSFVFSVFLSSNSLLGNDKCVVLGMPMSLHLRLQVSHLLELWVCCFDQVCLS